MPIRPELRKFYGKEWRELRLVILERDGGRCVDCGKPDRVKIARRADGVWLDPRFGWRAPNPDGVKWNGDRWIPGEPIAAERPKSTERVITVVLSVCHDDHIAGNDSPANLRARCQRCHLLHDAPQHRDTRSERKDHGRPLLYQEAS